eukprot:3213729-Prymnesium_polylepis.1
MHDHSRTPSDCCRVTWGRTRGDANLLPMAGEGPRQTGASLAVCGSTSLSEIHRVRQWRSLSPPKA